MSALVVEHKKSSEKDCGSPYLKKSRADGNAAELNAQDYPIVRRTAGNLATERWFRSSQSAATFKINPPDDVHEQEANELAAQATEAAQGSHRRNPTKLPRASNPKTYSAEASFKLSSGHPLDAAMSALFEPRLGADLSRIRVHTDDEAAAIADAIDAEAFTIGSQIVFGSHRYQPNTSAGQRLLAHELVHAVQQTSHPRNAFRSSLFHGHTSPGVIQRQPRTGTGAAITEPVGFIEDQLKLRFSSPDDPGLIIRVQRLQEAFMSLNISESSRLLDRLRDSSDEIAKNFQRLATPSRNKLRAILLNKLPAEIEGKTLGKVSSGMTLFELPLIARMEVTPSTEEAGMFEGYATIDEARDAVIRLPTISAVVFDKKLKRFRAFDTGFPTIRNVPQLRVAATESGFDYELRDWVNLEDEEVESKDRLNRIVMARKLVEDYVKTYKYDFLTPTGGGKTVDPAQAALLKNIKDAYRDLFEESLPFARGQFDFAFEFDPTTPTGEKKELTTAQPGKINIDVLDIYAHGHQKMLDPLADLDYPGAHARASFKDALAGTSAVPPEPYIALSRGALDEEPLETRRVFLHERAHLAHAQRASQLIEQWKSAGAGGTFKSWVENEVKSRRVSAIDAILAVERVEQPAGTLAYNTETLAEVEGFISVYHAIPLGRNLALERLPVLAKMWIRSDSVVQDLSIRKLKDYYSRMLDKSYRDAFLKYVTDLWQTASGKSDPLVDFYLKLTEFYEMGD